MTKQDLRSNNPFRDITAKQVEEAFEAALESLVGKPVLVRIDGLNFDPDNGFGSNRSVTIKTVNARLPSAFELGLEEAPF